MSAVLVGLSHQETPQLFSYHVILGFPGGSVVKNPSDNAGAIGDGVPSLGWEDPLK